MVMSILLQVLSSLAIKLHFEAVRATRCEEVKNQELTSAMYLIYYG
jgi:hypothetical protein